MYSYEDCILAVKFYIIFGYNSAYTVRKLGYLNATSLKHWHQESPQYIDPHQGKFQAIIESCNGILKTSQIADIYNVTPSTDST